MRGLHRSLALVLAGSTALIASCSGQAAGPTATPKASIAPSPAVSSTVGETTGEPIDISTLSGRITFSNGTDDIWAINADGSDLKQLTTDGHEDFDPAWSPDGRSITFRSMRDGDNEVYVMGADGSRQVNVSRDRADDWGPAWSPNGLVVWNCALELSLGFHACVARPDGSGRRIIPVERYFEYPAWSPDGSKIAFMSQQEGAHGNDPNYDIFLVNSDGSGLRQLTDAPGEDGFPSWSPDGSQIAFSTTRDDCSNSEATDCRTTGDIGPYSTIYVMNANGTDQHRLSLQFGQFVDWSPDGRYLVFSPGLQVIRPDGTGLTSIPVNPRPEPEFADWGP